MSILRRLLSQECRLRYVSRYRACSRCREDGVFVRHGRENRDVEVLRGSQEQSKVMRSDLREDDCVDGCRRDARDVRDGDGDGLHVYDGGLHCRGSHENDHVRHGNDRGVHGQTLSYR